MPIYSGFHIAMFEYWRVMDFNPRISMEFQKSLQELLAHDAIAYAPAQQGANVGQVACPDGH
jgi:hypothetical protein